MKSKPSEIFATPAGQDTPFGYAVWRARPVITGAFHQHNDVEVVAMERGSMSYLYGGKLVTLRENEASIFWATRPHQVVKGDANAFCRGVTVPLRWFLERRLPEMLAGRLLQGGLLTVPLSESIADFCVLSDGWIDDIGTGEEGRLTAMWVELEAWFRRVALVLADPELGQRLAWSVVPRHSAEGMDKIEQMAAFVNAHYTEPITSEEVAEAAGLDAEHGVHLFHQKTGCTLTDFITQQRLAHAQLLLATTQLTVLDVAMEAGFGSSSRFYAVFRQALDMSPMQYRREHHLESAPPNVSEFEDGVVRQQ